MKAEFYAFAQSVELIPKPVFPEIAFVGRSNVGKSSLINTLLGQKLARTSHTPGRTQGLCFFKVDSKFTFVDFPGFGYAKISKTLRESWASLADFYFRNRPALRGTIWIYDLRRDPDRLDFQMKEWLQTQGHPFCLALTKADKLKRTQWGERRQSIIACLGLKESDTFIFSSKTKEGLKIIWRVIHQLQKS